MRFVRTEPESPPGLVVCPVGEFGRYTKFWKCLEELCVPPGSDWIMPDTNYVGVNINCGIEAVLASAHWQWLWIIADDHTFAPDTVLRLLAHEVDVVAPVCLGRKAPWQPMGALTLDDEREECTSAGLGFLASQTGLVPFEHVSAGSLIRRPVLEAIPPPWWEPRLVQGAAHPQEDMVFSLKVKQAGFKQWTDCDLTIGHIDQHEVWPMRSPDGKKWGVRMLMDAGTALEVWPDGEHKIWEPPILRRVK